MYIDNVFLLIIGLIGIGFALGYGFSYFREKLHADLEETEVAAEPTNASLEALERLKTQLDYLETKQASYRQQVIQSFVDAAKIINDDKGNTARLFKHLEQSAITLVGRDEFRQALRNTTKAEPRSNTIPQSANVSSSAKLDEAGSSPESKDKLVDKVIRLAPPPAGLAQPENNPAKISPRAPEKPAAYPAASPSPAKSIDIYPAVKSSTASHRPQTAPYSYRNDALVGMDTIIGDGRLTEVFNDNLKESQEGFLTRFGQRVGRWFKRGTTPNKSIPYDTLVKTDPWLYEEGDFDTSPKANDDYLDEPSVSLAEIYNQPLSPAARMQKAQELERTQIPIPMAKPSQTTAVKSTPEPKQATKSAWQSIAQPPAPQVIRLQGEASKFKEEAQDPLTATTPKAPEQLSSQQATPKLSGRAMAINPGLPKDKL